MPLIESRENWLKPDECVIVEDAATGIEPARASGFHTVGLRPHERVGAADVVLDSLKGVTHSVVSDSVENIQVYLQAGSGNAGIDSCGRILQPS